MFDQLWISYTTIKMQIDIVYLILLSYWVILPTLLTLEELYYQYEKLEYTAITLYHIGQTNHSKLQKSITISFSIHNFNLYNTYATSVPVIHVVDRQTVIPNQKFTCER